MAPRGSDRSDHHLELGNYERPEATAMQHAISADKNTEGINAWKKKTPYRAREPSENFIARYEGECHCGEVKYQLSREKPLDVKFCHCSTCQTQHGAPFQWAAIFHKDDINFVHGHHNLEWYDPSTKTADHKLPCKVRCAFCHTPIMDEGRNMILLFPSLIKMDEKDRPNFRPRCHMFYGARAVDINDRLPKWSGLSLASNLIGDTTPEYQQLYQKHRENQMNK